MHHDTLHLAELSGHALAVVFPHHAHDSLGHIDLIQCKGDMLTERVKGHKHVLKLGDGILKQVSTSVYLNLVIEDLLHSAVESIVARLSKGRPHRSLVVLVPITELGVVEICSSRAVYDISNMQTRIVAP